MLAYINKDTKLCISLASRPGNFGTRFHNFLYDKMGLNFIYKAFTTNHLEDAIKGVRALNIRGCAVSMPFKETVIPLVDTLNDTAKKVNAVNTIVNDGGYLTAYNTDYMAVKELLTTLSNELKVVLQGSGGMAKAFACALNDLGFKNTTILSRNTQTGSALAKFYDFKYLQEIDEEVFDVLINATPIGMNPAPETEVSFSEETINKAEYVFDSVATPAETGLIKLARSLGKKVVPGDTITLLQSKEQFILYTGTVPSQKLIEQATEFARSEN